MRLKKLLSKPETLIRTMFAAFALVSLLFAALAPDRADMLRGLARLCTQSGQTAKNFLDPSYGGISGTFLNCALVALACMILYFLPGSRPDGTAVLAFFLTVGFCSWGMTILNIWFSFAGVALYCLFRKRRAGEMANVFLFSTGLSPLITELLFRYPGETWHGFTWGGFAWALAIGVLIGFLLPAILEHAPQMHKGFTLYNAAVPIGLTAFFLRALLYKVFTDGHPVSEGVGLELEQLGVTMGFLGAIFGLALAGGLLLGGGRQYGALLRQTGFDTDFSVSVSPAAALLNFGVYGVFVMLYFTAVGAVWNGVLMGNILCMVCCSFRGSHPLNVWPIMVGYALTSFAARAVCGLTGAEFTMALNAQAIVIGMCYASGLCPIAGRYGWHFGLLCGMLHYILVTCTPLLHGSFCLYNGGFTAAFCCFLLVPVLEHYARPKSDRPARAKRP